jgi:hypothetical protein
MDPPRGQAQLKAHIDKVSFQPCLIEERSKRKTAFYWGENQLFRYTSVWRVHTLQLECTIRGSGRHYKNSFLNSPVGYCTTQCPRPIGPTYAPGP